MTRFAAAATSARRLCWGRSSGRGVDQYERGHIRRDAVVHNVSGVSNRGKLKNVAGFATNFRLNSVDLSADVIIKSCGDIMCRVAVSLSPGVRIWAEFARGGEFPGEDGNA
jgi:hypothetical protein